MPASTANPQHTSVTSSASSLTLAGYAVPAGSNKILSVSVGMESTSPGTTISSVTHNGVNLTARSSLVLSTSGGLTQYTQLWDLQLGSGTPTGDIVVTPSATVSNCISIAAVTLQDVVQQAPEASASNTGTSTSISTNITTITDGALIVDSVCTNPNSGPTATGTGHVADVAVADTSGLTIEFGQGHVVTTTAGTYTVGWSALTARVAHALLSYEASGGGGGFTAVNRRTIGQRVGSRTYS